MQRIDETIETKATEQKAEFIEIIPARGDLAKSHNPGVKELRENGFFIKPAPQKSLMKDFLRGQIRFAIKNLEEDEKKEPTFITYQNFNDYLVDEPEHSQEFKDDADRLKKALQIAYAEAEIMVDQTSIEKTFSEIEHAYSQNCISTSTNLLHAALESVSADFAAPAPMFYQGTIYLTERRLVAEETAYRMVVAQGELRSTSFAYVHKKSSVSADTTIEMVLETHQRDTEKLNRELKQLQDEHDTSPTEGRANTAKRGVLKRKMTAITEQTTDTRPEFKITNIKTRCAYIRDVMKMHNGKIPALDLDVYVDETIHPPKEDYELIVAAKIKEDEDKKIADEAKLTEQEIAVKISSECSAMRLAATQARNAVNTAANRTESASKPMYKTLPAPQEPIQETKEEKEEKKPEPTSITVTAKPKQDVQPKTAAPKRSKSILKQSTPTTGMGKAHQQYKTAPKKHKSLAKAIGWKILGAAVAVASYFGAVAAMALSPFISPVGAAAVAGGIIFAGTAAMLACMGKATENYDEYAAPTKPVLAKKKKTLTIVVPEEKTKEGDTPSPEYSPSARRDGSIKLPSLDRSKSASQPDSPSSVSSMTVEYSPKHSALVSLGINRPRDTVDELKVPLLQQPETGNVRP